MNITQPPTFKIKEKAIQRMQNHIIQFTTIITHKLLMFLTLLHTGLEPKPVFYQNRTCKRVFANICQK
jgi:hypothetical protein